MLTLKPAFAETGPVPAAAGPVPDALRSGANDPSTDLSDLALRLPLRSQAGETMRTIWLGPAAALPPGEIVERFGDHAAALIQRVATRRRRGAPGADTPFAQGGSASGRETLRWETDSELRYSDLDTASGLFLDVPVTALLGVEPWTAFDPESAFDGWREHRASLRQRRPFSRFVFPARNRFGEPRWLESNGRPCFDSTGAFVGYRGSMIDITDRHRADLDLQRRARQQQDLAALCRLALRGTDMTELMRACAEIVDRTLDADLAGFFEITPDLRLHLRAGTGWRGTGGERRAIGFAIHAGAGRDARPVIITDVAAAQHDRIGTYVSDRDVIVGIPDAIACLAEPGALEDAAPRDRGDFARADLHVLEALAFVLGAAIERHDIETTLRLRDRALAVTGQGVVVARVGDSACRIVSVNDAFERMFGHGGPGLIGSDLVGVYSVLFGRDQAEAVARSVRSRGHFSGRARGVRDGGTTYWDEFTVSAVAEAESGPTHWVAVHADVTARVDLEDKLPRARHLETSARLARGMAREIEERLGSLRGGAETLAGVALPESARRIATRIGGAARHGSELARLIGAILPRDSQSAATCDIVGATEDLAPLLRRSLGAGIETIIAATVPQAPVRADRAAVQTALLDLVLKARDAMPAGGRLTIGIDARPRAAGTGSPDRPPGSCFVLSISDTGIGLPAAGRPADEPAGQGPSGRDPGAGLPIACHLVDAVGGRIEIDCRAGVGTTVRLVLPCAPASAAAD